MPLLRLTSTYEALVSTVAASAGWAPTNAASSNRGASTASRRLGRTRDAWLSHMMNLLDVGVRCRRTGGSGSRTGVERVECFGSILAT
ncbi:hypothetical protein GCM10018771_49030 [Streptomyces cellulosae]|nr:hypothetical protein GCM10018771_49030 [Streptomyces cellulosae]